MQGGQYLKEWGTNREATVMLDSQNSQALKGKDLEPSTQRPEH